MLDPHRGRSYSLEATIWPLSEVVERAVFTPYFTLFTRPDFSRDFRLPRERLIQ